MRPFRACIHQTPCLYLRDIPTTDVLPVFGVVVTVRLLRIANVQRFRVVAMSSMPGVLTTLIVRETSSFASIEARVYGIVIGELKACIEGSIPILTS